MATGTIKHAFYKDIPFTTETNQYVSPYGAYTAISSTTVGVSNTDYAATGFVLLGLNSSNVNTLAIREESGGYGLYVYTKTAASGTARVYFVPK